MPPLNRHAGFRDRLATALALVCFPMSSSAVELEDLTGDWTLSEISTPTSLRETYYNTETETIRISEDSQDFAKDSEILTDAFYPDPLVTETRSFTISSTSAVTGGETGQILSFSSNRMLYSDGEDASTVYSNTKGDILLSSERGEDRQDQTLCLKRPTDLSSSDLAGDWKIISMINPDDLRKNDVEGRLSDVWFPGESSISVGDISVTGAGNFSGIFSGTISGNPTGDITVINDGDAIPFKANASKNVLIATLGDDDEQEYVLIVKKPQSVTTAELAGTWRISVLRIPTTLTEVFYNVISGSNRDADSEGVAGPNEILVDLWHADKFELDRMQIQVGAEGGVTGSISGTLAANGGQSVSLSTDGDSIPLYPNSDKSFMMGSTVGADFHELIVCIKTSDSAGETFDETTDLQVIPTSSSEKILFNWNSASNLCLEEYSAETGWTEVEVSAGGDSHVVDTSAKASGLFRIAEKP